MKIKNLLGLPLIILTLILTGCGVTVSNLTPRQAPQNPSGIYTISMAAHMSDADLIKDSVVLSIVINGEQQLMKKSPLSRQIYTYEFDMPEGLNEAKYYFMVNYDVAFGSKRKPREYKTEIYDLKLINRYVISMESNRGPVGSEIPVVGRGFTEFDTVEVGGIEADTIVASSNSLAFIVPALEANQTYPVRLISGNGSMKIGNFHIDPSSIKVNQKQLDLSPDEHALLLFQIDFDAPKHGFLVDVTTDVPGCIIMPEVMIQEGTRTVSVEIAGGEPGKGTLFITAPGFKETVLPITVSQNYDYNLEETDFDEDQEWL